MGRYGVTLDEMKESTRAFFKNQRESVRNKEQGNTISNYQQPQQLPAQRVSINPQVESPPPPTTECSYIFSVLTLG